MAQRMTWNEIKKNFPDEWVALTNLEGDTNSPFGNISAEMIVHSRDEKIFTTQLKENSQYQQIDIRFTGDILPDNPVGPVLWQISDTNS